jgi:hypothetical protein
MNSITIDHRPYWISQYSEQTIKLPPTKLEEDAIANMLSDNDKDLPKTEFSRNQYIEIKVAMMQQL